MGIFRQFPYSNFHEMNMDEIIKIMREMQDEWTATKAEWASYKDFIDNYFANLDVSQEVLDALRVMAGDGTLNTIIDPVIATETAAWLLAHITPTTPAIDNSLTVAGAGADAEVTGKIRENLPSIIQLPTNKKATYDYSTKVLTIPQGFLTYRNYSYALYAQAVTLPASGSGVLYYDHTNRVILAADFNTHYDCDSVVGAFYGQRVWINGLGQIETINSTTNVYGTGMAVVANRYGGFSVTGGNINIPQGFYAYNGCARALAAQTVPVPTNAYNAYLLQIDPTTDTVYTTDYGDKDSEDPIIGFGYYNNIYIFGLGSTMFSNNITAINNVMLSGSDTDSGYIYLDTTAMTLTIGRGGFIVPPNGVKINVNAQTCDFSGVTTTYGAYKVYIDKFGVLDVVAWTDIEYPEKFLIGTIYRNSLSLYGSGIIPMNNRVDIKVFGDSIPAGTGCNAPFHLLLSKKYNVAFKNHAVGSTGYYATTTSNVIVGNGVIGKGSAHTETGSNNVNDITAAVNSFDSVILFAGTNDYGNGVTSANFTTALRNTLDRVLSATSNILVITPIHRQTETANSAGLTLSDYADIIKTECASRHIMCIDGFDIPLNVQWTNHYNKFFTDALHPNDKGHQIIAGYVAPYVEQMLGVLKV